MTTIGFIGLGNMGNPMVNNLLKNNFSVKVYDISKKAIENCMYKGAIASSSIADIAKNSDVVITMLQTGEQVIRVCTGKQGVFENVKPNTLFLDCSSIDIKSSRELHEHAKSHGIAMLDAPVSGGVGAATAGTLTFMVGGDEKNFARADNILKAMGKKIIYAGDDTAGVAAKICNNMLLGISMIGVCEAFVLAEKLGLDPKKLFEISSNASGQCWSLTSYCPSPNILPSVPSSNGYKPGFTAKMMLKDLRLSQDAASLANTETPLGNHAMKLYEQFVAEHQDEIDFSAIIKMLAE